MKTTLKIFAVAAACLVLASCSKAPTDAKPGHAIAGNDYVDYTFDYPEEWELVRNDAMIAVKAPENNITLSCTSFDMTDADVLVQEYWDNYFESFKETFGGSIEIVKEDNELKLDGVPAKSVTYTATVVGTQYQFTQIIAIRNGTAYTITYTATPETYASFEGDLTTAVTSFKFEN